MNYLKTLLYAVLLCAAMLCYSCEKDSTGEGSGDNGGEIPEVSTAPEITAYSTKFNNKAVYDQEVVISGKNFAETKSDNIVMFNTTKANVLSSSTDQLVVRTPRLDVDHAVISVTVNEQESNKRAIYYDKVRCDSVLLFQNSKIITLRKGVVWKQVETKWHDAPRSINVVCITPSSKNKLGISLPNSLATTSTTCKAEDALVGINASYFGTTSSGFVRIDGKDVCAGTKYAADRYYQNNGVFVLNNNVAGIKAVENNAAAAQLPDENIQCCGPLLILDDVDEQQANVDHCNIDHPRTVVGVTADGRVLFVTVDGRFENKAIGMSTTMLQELMHLLGATHALNLDGGGSSTMYIKDRGVVNHVCNSGSTWDKVVERKVASILYVK